MYVIAAWRLFCENGSGKLTIEGRYYNIEKYCEISRKKVKNYERKQKR